MFISRKSTLQLFVAAALAASAMAHADDEFRIQAQAVYDKFEPDEDLVGDADSVSLTGTFFFNPVSTAGVPVGEAAYINRASFASVSASKIDTGIVDVDVLSADVGYHVPDTIFFGRVGVVRADVDLGGGDSVDDTTWNGTVGIVPIPRLFFGTDFTEDGYDANLTIRYAGKLSNDHWWAGSVSAVDPDEGDSAVGVQFDYYFPKFKLGGGFNSGDDRVSARAEVGLPNGFALQGSIYTDDFGDGLAVQLTWRDL